MSKEKLVRQYVASRMHRWQAAADSSKTRGELAQLRRELGKHPVKFRKRGDFCLMDVRKN